MNLHEVLMGTPCGDTVIDEARSEAAKEKMILHDEKIKKFKAQAKQTLTESVIALRYYRKQVRESEKLVKALDRATRYFEKTNNPLPYLSVIWKKNSTFMNMNARECGIQNYTDEMCEIPEDFK